MRCLKYIYEREQQVEKLCILEITTNLEEPVRSLSVFYVFYLKFNYFVPTCTQDTCNFFVSCGCHIMLGLKTAKSLESHVDEFIYLFS